MFTEIFFATALQFAPDTVLATLTIKPPTSDGPPIQWVLYDAQKRAIESGTTPAVLEKDVRDRVFTICNAAKDGQIAVAMTIAGGGKKLTGTSHCFVFGSDGKRFVLNGALDPHPNK